VVIHKGLTKISKIYSESLIGEEHLKQIQAEAHDITNAALAQELTGSWLHFLLGPVLFLQYFFSGRPPVVTAQIAMNGKTEVKNLTVLDKRSILIVRIL
jgi:hypothetical protein